MTSFRILAFTALALLPGVPALSIAPVLGEETIAAFSTAELMQATGLDVIFSDFGPGIASSARREEVSPDEGFIERWEATALSSFDAAAMEEKLKEMLDGSLSGDELQVFATFFHSDFGKKISGVERAVAELPTEAQIAVIAEGETMKAAATGRRNDQIGEMLALMSAEISGSIATESVRAMLMAMSLAHQQGEIEVPWAEIDAQVTAMQPGLLASVESGQRALMLYAYRDLSEVELDRYIEFLQTPAARKFYAVATYSIGRVVTGAMADFGDALARRMKSVNI